MKKVSSVCHIWPHLFMQVCSPKWKASLSQQRELAGESYPPSSKLVDMHANCRISASKPQAGPWDTKRNWNQLQNKQRYYIWEKGTWDKDWGKTSMWEGTKKIFSSKVSYFKSYARARAKWQSSTKYDLHFYLEKLLPKRNAFLSSWLSLWEEEKISLGKTTSTPDWTKKKIPKRILWRAKKRDSRTLLTLDQAKKFFLGHHHCTESPFFLNWKVLFVSSSFQAYLLSFPLFPLIAFEA